MKKILSLVSLLMMSFIGMQAQGIYAVKSGDDAVAAGTTVTSVENITFTWGVEGGADFKGGSKADNALKDVLGATAYCEGNGQNGALTDGVYSGTVYLFSPAIAGKVTVGIVLNANKPFFVKEGTDGTDVAFDITDRTGAAVTMEEGKLAEKLTGGLVSFDVVAGKTYAVYCTGSKLGFYGFKFEKAAEPEPEPVADGPIVLWENGETSTLDGYTYITIPASQLKDVAKAKDTIRVSFAIANVEARQATPARNVRTGEISLWFGVDEIKTISEINKDTKSVDFILKAADVEKLAAAESVSLKYKYLTVAKVELVSAVAVPEPEPVVVTFDISAGTLREPGTAMSDLKSNVYNETLIVDGVSMQITSGSAASKIYNDSKKGIVLAMYKEYSTLTFKAPEGKAITKIEFTLASGSLPFTTSVGIVDDNVWTGNAHGVRFLNGGTPYISKVEVTLVDENAETVALAAIDYNECANIAAFNALVAGSYAKVTLTDAEVIGISADGFSTAWIQDATGGCWIQYSSLNGRLTEKTKVNGTVYVVKRDNSGNAHMKEAEATLESVLEATPIDNYTIVEGTIEQVNVAANLNKVVKIDGATLEETSATAGKLTQGEVSIDVNNGTSTANQQLCKITDWAENTKLENIAMVAILVAKSATANQLLPISIETSTVGITNVSSLKVADVEIYNLQGVRMSQLQKGINIVNGKKVVIK